MKNSYEKWNTSGQRGNKFNNSCRDISYSCGKQRSCKAETLAVYSAKWNVKQYFKSADCTYIFYYCNKQWRYRKRHRWHPERYQKELYLRFVTCCVALVTKKRKPKPWPPNNSRIWIGWRFSSFLPNNLFPPPPPHPLRFRSLVSRLFMAKRL